MKTFGLQSSQMKMPPIRRTLILFAQTLESWIWARQFQKQLPLKEVLAGEFQYLPNH